MTKTITVLGLAAAMSIGLAGEALAHAHLKSAAPAPKSVVNTAPSALDLTFTEGVDLKFTGVTLTGPGKANVTLGTPSLMAGDDTVLMVPVTGTLAAGSYTVVWHALSTDGHKTKGSYGFTLKP